MYALSRVEIAPASSTGAVVMAGVGSACRLASVDRRTSSISIEYAVVMRTALTVVRSQSFYQTRIVPRYHLNSMSDGGHVEYVNSMTVISELVTVSQERRAEYEQDVSSSSSSMSFLLHSQLLWKHAWVHFKRGSIF
jgi:hypothetical protein